MKKTYIAPTVMFEDLEMDSYMAANSQWDINGSNAAGDNDNQHGGGLGGGTGDGQETDPDYEIPGLGD